MSTTGHVLRIVGVFVFIAKVLVGVIAARTVGAGAAAFSGLVGGAEAADALAEGASAVYYLGAAAEAAFFGGVLLGLGELLLWLARRDSVPAAA